MYIMISHFQLLQISLTSLATGNWWKSLETGSHMTKPQGNKKTLQTISIKPCNFQQHSWQKCQQYQYHHFLHRALIFARDAPGVEDMERMIRLMR